MRSSSFAIESVNRTNETVVTIDISECFFLWKGQAKGQRSKRAASKATSCPEKAPCCSVVNDDEFQSLQALQHTTPLSGCTFNNCSFSVPVPQPKHKEIVEDDFSSIDITEFFSFSAL